MRANFVEGLLRKSVPQLEQSLCSASIERAAVVYIRSVSIQDKKRNRNGGCDDFLLNCSICWEGMLQIVH